MKQKINLRLIAISILAVVTTVISITFVHYEIFKSQVKKELKTEIRIVSAAGISEIVENVKLNNDKDLRITWISETGDVIFDNDADNLSNHLDRPEVIEAFKNGIGESIRESDTMNMSSFYYAVLLEDGTVLRVSTEARSVINVFFKTFPVTVFILVMILGVCAVISHILTKQLLEPIKEMADDINNTAVKNPYKELDPFVQRIREQHNDILAGAKMRQDFTANVSHELKTPITAISGYAELIENRMVDESQTVRFSKEIRKHAERLVTLVNDIIRLSELDYKEGIPEFSKTDVYEVVEERLEFLKTLAEEKKIELSLYGYNCYVNSDRGLLVELIDNLVQNAIRYNVFGGKVDVYVKQKETHVELTVSDTGIGIPASDQERVFERFYRVDKSRSRETGGTGLGLAIVKHIVELHDGEIILDSELGRGTSITVRFS